MAIATHTMSDVRAAVCARCSANEVANHMCGLGNTRASVNVRHVLAPFLAGAERVCYVY